MVRKNEAKGDYGFEIDCLQASGAGQGSVRTHIIVYPQDPPMVLLDRMICEADFPRHVAKVKS